MYSRSSYLARGFFVAAALMAPWTLYLAVTLPRHYSAHHYWLGWAGFDVMLITVLVITGLSIRRGSRAVTRYAAVAATLLVMDAWFDVLNAGTGADRLLAVSTAVVLELPLAYICWQLSVRSGDTALVEEGMKASRQNQVDISEEPR